MLYLLPFALPHVFTAQEAARLRTPELSSSSLAYLFDLAEAAREKTGKDVPVRLPDIQSPMDIAALIWEKSDFFIAMIEDPEAVRELAEKVRQLLMTFLDEWFRRFGTGYVAHYPHYWMEGGLTLSEDEVGAVNPEMFETFFLPELQILSERYGGLGMHCCANARHQWEGFARIPGLRFPNLVQPEKKIREAIPYFKNSTAQWHGMTFALPQDNFMLNGYQDAHLVLESNAATREEAMEVAALHRQTIPSSTST